jgi:hypothetical protein
MTQGALLAAFNLAQGKPGCAAAFATLLVGFGAAWVIGGGRLGAPLTAAAGALVVALLLPGAAASAGLALGALRVLPQIARTLATRDVANLSPCLFGANLLAAALIAGLELTAPDTRLVNVANFSLVVTANAIQLAVMALYASHSRASASVMACSGTASR